MINLSYLRKTTNNDKEVILQLIDIFKSQLPDFKENILNAFNQQNWQKLKEESHKAKNSFQIMGIQKTAELLGQIENKCLKNNEQICKSLIDEFIEEYYVIEEELKKGLEI